MLSLSKCTYAAENVLTTDGWACWLSPRSGWQTPPTSSAALRVWNKQLLRGNLWGDTQRARESDLVQMKTSAHRSRGDRCQVWERPHRRIRESSAAATQRAAHQPSGPQHFETDPLQRGLTGNKTLAVLDAQLPKKHTHTPHCRLWQKLTSTQNFTVCLIFYKDVRLHAERTSFMELPTPGLLWE